MQPDQAASILPSEIAHLQLGIAVDGQTLEPAPGEAQAQDLKGVQEGRTRFRRGGSQNKGEKAAGAREVPLPQLVSRRPGQGGVEDSRDLVLGLEPFCDDQTALPVPPEPDIEGAQSPEHGVGVLSGDGPAEVNDARLKPGGDAPVPGRGGSHEGV